MKKEKSLFNSAAIFLGISITFNFLYNLLNIFNAAIGTHTFVIGSIISTVISSISLVFTILLLIGVIKKEKIFFILFYVYNILSGIVNAIVYLPTAITSQSVDIAGQIFSSLGSVFFNTFMLILILGMFAWKKRMELAEKQLIAISNYGQPASQPNMQVNIPYNANAISPEKY